MNTAVSGRTVAFRGIEGETCAVRAAPLLAETVETAEARWAPARTPALQAETGAGTVDDEPASKVVVLRAALVVGVLLAVVVAGLAASRAAPAAEPELALLLRGMAAIKGLLAVSAAGLVWWRFGQPVSARAAVAYIACTSVLSASTVLIWQFAFILAAAGLFHAAALVGSVVAVGDGRSMSGSWRKPVFSWERRKLTSAGGLE